MKATAWIAGMLLVVAAWVFYEKWLLPIAAQEKECHARIEALRAKLENARQATREVQAIEQKATVVRAELNRWRRERPAASAMAWFPERVARHFSRQGINGAVTRLNTAKKTLELPGFQRTYWAVDLPMANRMGETGRALLAVAELEQAEPHLRVLDFSIRHDPQSPAQRTAVLNVSELVRE